MLLLADAMAGGVKVPPAAATAEEMLANVPPDLKPCTKSGLELAAAVNTLPGMLGAMLKQELPGQVPLRMLKLDTNGGLLPERSMICAGYRSEKNANSPR